ncbi:MAG: outer membrane lipoprotein-sorting protein [Desulfobacteraceae bacterium]|nr:outer membrane lipoprotein-sorting protein [Desulfobacteraceae bacterium]
MTGKPSAWHLFFLYGVVFFALITFPCRPLAGQQLSVREMLQKSDGARGNLGGVSWTLKITAWEQGRDNNRTIHVRSRGFDVVAETLTPAHRRGHMLIMLQGNMWFYKPGLSKPVPVSKRQRLLGLATNGDIASTNYAENYDIIKEDHGLVDGEECLVFDLRAKSGNATYRCIRYWVSRRRLVGVRAEFYTTNGGRLLKSARMEYANRVPAGGGQRPFISRMVIHDNLMSKDWTILDFSDPMLQAIPPALFNINLLGQ